jgi:hypothetical protein
VTAQRGRGKSRKSLDLIEVAYTILREIQPATLRAVCYKLFVLGIISSMTKKSELNKVSTQITWARENGSIPWGWVVDGERPVRRVSAWENPAEYAETVKRSYRRDRWTDQSRRVEVWSEKATVLGVLQPVLDEYGVTFRSMKGYSSATAVYQAAQDSLIGTKLLEVLYLGDWDPSGLHMSEVDLPARLKEYGGIVALRRLALTTADTLSGLPSFPVETKKGNEKKKGDPRYRWYLDAGYGLQCWELDALSPVTLRKRVEDAIRTRLDLDAWDRADVVEKAEQESLTSILNAWPGISGQASKYAGPQP